MTQRTSISVEGLSHLTAIPVATRIGPLLVSSVIAPFNPGTREVPATIEAPVANLFHHAGAILQAAGADWQHVAKMEFWVPSADARLALEAPWRARFPDAASRPSRHTHISAGGAPTASLLAYVPE